MACVAPFSDFPFSAFLGGARWKSMSLHKLPRASYRVLRTFTRHGAFRKSICSDWRPYAGPTEPIASDPIYGMSPTTRHERPQPRHATSLKAPCRSSQAASRSRVSAYVFESCCGRSTRGHKPQEQWWPHRRFGSGPTYAIFRTGCAERARAITPEVTRRAGEAGKPRNVSRGGPQCRFRKHTSSVHRERRGPRQEEISLSYVSFSRVRSEWCPAQPQRVKGDAVGRDWREVSFRCASRAASRTRVRAREPRGARACCVC